MRPCSTVYVYEDKGSILSFTGLMDACIGALFVSGAWQSKDEETKEAIHSDMGKHLIFFSECYV